MRFAANLGASTEDARELVQDAFLRLLRYKDDRPAHEWTPLTYRILLNLFRDHQRSALSREVRWEPSEIPSSEAMSPEDHSPERQAILRERAAALRKAILNFPPRTREIYLLHRLKGWTYPAIAKHCGISVKAVEKHISRALRDLRRDVDGECAPPSTGHTQP